MSVWPTPRALAGSVKRLLFPKPAEAAWRRILTRAGHEARYTPGRLPLLGFDLEYVDAVSLAPQWHDLFVRRTLDFRSNSHAPRVLDCGANVGLASLSIKQQYPGARITAFEPDEGICEVLRRNLSRNGAGDVEIVRAAVWREDGTIAFRHEGSDSGAIDAVGGDTPGRVVEVPAVRLRRWIESDDVHLLKLDIEGAELDVLEDVSDLLDRVRTIQVEVHDFAPDRRLLPRCLTLLERAGFTYALDDFGPANWRPSTHARGPFAHAVPSWIILVRAWRTGAGAA